MVEPSWQVNLDARKFVVLLLLEAQAKPVARQEESAVSVDVEALMGIPSRRAARNSVLLRL